MLSYQAKMVGINVIITEESYTSASSFIDNDLIPVYKKGQNNQVTFSGKRIKRCSAVLGVSPMSDCIKTKRNAIVPQALD
ncbi:hypothetical protein [Okeania sp. SIO2C2]|uniref:hypothetical protein n=1 Tax=Okeania sp. SIO2C2 TaxID=2607787 RepID=UPI00257F96BB|nr:hypothetical protein [Okeania sp. SIO2C2]